MVNLPRASPFGVLFEEHAPEAVIFPAPDFDTRTDISYFRGPDGRLVPYVEVGPMGTDTATKIRRESTDTDAEDEHGTVHQPLTLVGTDTFTKQEKETTDRD